MIGRLCRVERLIAEHHGPQLWAALVGDDGPLPQRGIPEHPLPSPSRGMPQDLWTYLSYGPPRDEDDYLQLLASQAAADEPLFFAIVDQVTEQAVGVASFLRIQPAVGSVEVGHILYTPRLQRTPAATEAMALMARRVFEQLGYRRYEWKCDALNAASWAAALRLGFQFEGIFRQAGVSKGRNRDTAWFSILDGEWPALARAYQRWLEPANFDAAGRQLQSLATLRRTSSPLSGA